jgi:hypothetical protein
LPGNPLAKLAAHEESDAEAQRDAIVQAVAIAIRALREPYYSAARDHFGFEDTDLNTKPLGKVERETNAARHLGRTSQAWYYKAGRGPNYLDKTPSEYVIALVTAALCGAPDPETYLAIAAPRAKADTPAPALLHPRRRVWPRPALAGMATLIIVVASAAALGAFSAGGRADTLPTPGSVIDASTGKVSPPGSSSAHVAGTTSQLLEAGAYLCVTHQGVCVSRSAMDRRGVAKGILHLRLALFGQGNAPIPAITLHAHKRTRITGTDVSVTTTWREASSASASPKNASISSDILVRFADLSNFYLKYIPGTTYLSRNSQGGSDRLITRLPDGLFSPAGITLSDLPVSPPGCYDCYQSVVRLIDFSMDVI